MKNADIKNKNVIVGDIQDQLTETKAQYSKLKLLHAISPIENPIQIRDLRKRIARLNTELTNKQ